jgi:hypothetical protein
LNRKRSVGMRFQVGQKRNGLAAGNFFLVLSAVTVGLIVVTAALISQGTSSLPTNPNDHSSSSSLGSSSVFYSSSSFAQSSVQSSSVSSNSSSSFIQSSVQSSSVSSNSSLSQSAVQYPLAWGPNPPSACDAGAFCIDVTLGFSGQTATTNTTSATATTIIQGNATTIILSSTTTIIRNNGTETTLIAPPFGSSYYVVATAFVQDAVTGQNATRPDGGGPFIQSGCYIQPTGFAHCLVSAWFFPTVAPGDPYKVTVFVTKEYTPCSLQKAGQCSSQLLAPPSPTVTVSW